jgi:hypothetical protein
MRHHFCLLLHLFHLPSFASSFATHEHIYIGSTVQLTLPGLNGTKKGNETLLHFPNGNVWVTFADVVGLGGDFYGFPRAAISDATGADNQRIAFNNSFNTLFWDRDKPVKKDPGYAPSSQYNYQSHQYIAGPEITLGEQIAKVRAAGLQPSQAYANCGGALDERRNVVSGGGSLVSDWIPFGRFIKLAETNWDHFSFGGRAWAAYAAGHSLAIQKAQEAYAALPSSVAASMDLVLYEDLVLYAYALEAFALHFLTDAFSSGHMRTPRKKFVQVCTPEDIGSYLSRYQHDEECKYGLNVTNNKGSEWRAYGDKKYLDDVNAQSRVICEACVQSSVDEIATVLKQGTWANMTNGAIDPVSFAAADCIPFPVKNEDDNITPLFKWDGTDLLRRYDVNDLWGKKFKKHGGLEGWWSTTTLVELETVYGPPSDLPPFPNRSRLEVASR